MNRTPFIAGNWKLHLNPQQSGELASQLREHLAGHDDVDLAVFPTALSVPAVLEALDGAAIGVGVQDVHHEAQGAFTGANSPKIAREAGCTYTLVGHSERRQLFGESDEVVGRKLGAALDAGLLPILCIGETLEQRDAGRVTSVVHQQLAAAFEGQPADRAATVTIAYEPVWAIGTGRTATPDQAQEVHQAIRSWLADRFASWVAQEVRIQYGGSVKPANAAELLAQPDIDGALVGGASLDAQSFAAIAQATR